MKNGQLAETVRIKWAVKLTRTGKYVITLKQRTMKLLKHKNWKILTYFAWYLCMMSLLPDEAGLHLFLIHFCPSDVFCLPSQIPSTLLEVRSFCRFLLPCWKPGPFALLKITVLLEIRSLLHMKKTWRVPRKHKNAYPPHRPSYWLVLKSNKIFIIGNKTM